MIYLLISFIYRVLYVPYQTLTIGENSSREAYNGCSYARHAEMDAIMKLPPLYQKKAKRKKISLIVIRIDKNGILKNSKPCFKCIEYMIRLNHQSGYKIEHIYYSNENGDIIIKKLSELEHDENKHVSWGFRKS